MSSVPQIQYKLLLSLIKNRSYLSRRVVAVHGKTDKKVSLFKRSDILKLI